MALGSSERNDLAAPSGSPIGNRGRAAPATLLENRDGHDERKLAHSDVHPSIADFIIGSLINERRQTSHTQSPTDTLVSGCDGAVKCKMVTAVNRQADERPANDPLPIGANDNGEDRAA